MATAEKNYAFTVATLDAFWDQAMAYYQDAGTDPAEQTTRVEAIKEALRKISFAAGGKTFTINSKNAKVLATGEWEGECPIGQHCVGGICVDDEVPLTIQDFPMPAPQ